MVRFWHERHAHYVPRFRGYGYPGLNLAEPGQSTMRTKRMTLVDAAFDDILKQMYQDELYAATLRNEVDGIGCQSKTVMQIMVECEAEQKKRALLYIKTLQEFKQTGGKLWQENPPTHDLEDPSYFIPEESASHKLINPDEAKKKTKSHQKRKVTQETIQKPKKKKRTDVGPATPATCATTEGPETPAICTTPEGPVTPQTPATQKGKVKGKSCTPKTPSVVTPNPNDYGPLVPDAIEKALLQTEVPNIVMYNPRIQGCYYRKCHHKWDVMFMIPPNNMLSRMKTYREYTRKADGIRVKNTYKSNAFYCLETMECVHGVNKGARKNHIYMSNFYFQCLTPGHVAILKELGYWDHILANRACVAADGPKTLGGQPEVYEF